MKSLSSVYIFIVLLYSLVACQAQSSETQSTPVTETSAQSFSEYWYQGKAEISSYSLQQARYGEIHEGDAVLVFVTEDFSAKKQVKLDYGPAEGDTRVPILKLNFTKKFITGIYPYSMLLSIFSPVDLETYPHSLKTTMSSQEWCGHTFTQLNLDEDQYQMTGLSYFESEGDEQTDIPVGFLEDELWTRIRLDHQSLPIGEFELIPGSFFSRLKHKEIKAVAVEAQLQPVGTETPVMEYSLRYADGSRSLKIQFDQSFPHRILGWEERYRDGYGPNAPMLTTRAQLKESILSDYWNRNNNVDRPLRKQLGLDE